MLDAGILNGYLKRNIAEICPIGFISPADNHCAHFVAHVLQLDFGFTCGRACNRKGGANVRVHEIFAHCPTTHEILDRQTDEEGLIFVSASSSFKGSPTRLENIPKKHLGLLLGKKVWHYSNSKKQVVRENVKTFANHYPNQENAIWFGSLPAGSRLQAAAESDLRNLRDKI